MEPRKQAAAGGLKPLDRRRPFRPGRPAAIGDGRPGGKAAGLIEACRALRDHFGAPEPGGSGPDGPLRHP